MRTMRSLRRSCNTTSTCGWNSVAIASPIEKYCSKGSRTARDILPAELPVPDVVLDFDLDAAIYVPPSWSNNILSRVPVRLLEPNLSNPHRSQNTYCTFTCGRKVIPDSTLTAFHARQSVTAVHWNSV